MAGRRNEKPKSKTNVENLRLEALKVTIEKKKECNSRALDIVTKLSEGVIVEDILLNHLQDINQEHYQDIVEERAINKLCGYPLCGNVLRNIPTKQFHISTTHNKVYDITDRKNFCSNVCYKASKYLKDQILTSPLWLRDGSESSTYQLFPLKSEGVFAGDEVDFGITSLKADLDKISRNDNIERCNALNSNAFSSTDKSEAKNSFSQVHNSLPVKVLDKDACETLHSNVSSGSLKCEQIGTIYETECKSDALESMELENELYSESELDKQTKKQLTSLDDNLTNLQNLCLNPKSKVNLLGTENIIDIQSKQEVHDPNCSSNSYCNIPLKKSKPNDNTSSLPSAIQSITAASEISTTNSCIKKPMKRKSGKKNNVLGQLLPMQNVVIKTEEILKEWFTLESLCFVFSEAKVKELLAEKSVISKQWQNASGTSTVDSNFYERYLAICRKLNILELEDTKTDASFREETKKPLPDYDALKKEAKELDLKVKMFYRGDKVVQFDETGQNSSNSDSTILQEPVLPLVDLHAQKALRRRIVLDKLRKTLQDLQGSLGIRGFNLGEDVRALVVTFNLSAHNVTMKPAEWNLMAIIIIKLLSLRDKSLELGLNNDWGKKHLALLLLSYSLDNGYLDRLICWLTDIDLLIKK